MSEVLEKLDKVYSMWYNLVRIVRSCFKLLKFLIMFDLGLVCWIILYVTCIIMMIVAIMYMAINLN